MEKCTICDEKATKDIQVVWKGKEKFIPRCDNHITKGYKGTIKKLKLNGGKASPHR